MPKSKEQKITEDVQDRQNTPEWMTIKKILIDRLMKYKPKNILTPDWLNLCVGVQERPIDMYVCVETFRINGRFMVTPEIVGSPSTYSCKKGDSVIIRRDFYKDTIELETDCLEESTRLFQIDGIEYTRIKKFLRKVD